MGTVGWAPARLGAGLGGRISSLLRLDKLLVVEGEDGPAKYSIEILHIGATIHFKDFFEGEQVRTFNLK